MSIYYVYAYLRENQTPYYIGKGKGRRAWLKDHNCGLPGDRSRIVILQRDLEEQLALDIEVELIKHYGRRDLGTGILHNKTDGGRSPVLYGSQNGMTGRHHSAETLRKIRNSKAGKSRPNTKKIICPECDIEFAAQGFVHHCNKHHPDKDYLDSYRPYACKHCNQGAANKSSLRNHINKIHPGQLFECIQRNPAVKVLTNSV